MADAVRVVYQPYGHAGRTVGVPDTSRVPMVNGMDVTPEECRSVGTGLADVVNQRLDDDPHLDPVNERGALVEVALALGVYREPTVRGAVARHAFLTGPEAPAPVDGNARVSPRRRR